MAAARTYERMYPHEAQPATEVLQNRTPRTLQEMSIPEALSGLRSRENGLSDVEVAQRRAEFGLNRIASGRRQPLGARFVKTFTHFFALILWLAAGLAFVAEFYDPGTGMASLGIAILGVILINGVFSFYQEYRAERALEALERLLPPKVAVVRGGNVCQIDAEALVPGDIALFDDGDNIPADCRIIESFGLRVNNATLTGESLPVAKDERPSSEKDLLCSRNTLLAGTSIVAGHAKGLVFATGMQTEFGRIAGLSQQAAPVLSPLQREIVRLSHLIALLSAALGTFFFAVGRIVGLPFWDNLVFAVGVLVANVPEGLLPTVTLALAMGSQRMARRNALVRHLPSVETLGSATAICTDKTGTLAEGRMTIRQILLDGRLYDPEEAVRDSDLMRRNHRFFETALHCNTLKEALSNGRLGYLGDPMEIELVEMASQALPKSPPEFRIDEVPFDSDRRRLSILCTTPASPILYTKGALETVLPLCQLRLEDGRLEPMTTEQRLALLKQQSALAEDGLRVLALASRAVAAGCKGADLEQDLTFLGLVAFEDPPRPEVPAAIRKCKEAGLKVYMVTGDHPERARAIACQIGLIETDNPIVMTGDELRQLTNTELQLALEAPEIVFARISADQKMRIVEALQAKREVVAVTGDGVNDAPALRKADIGVAMGRSGTDVARAAADMVLADDNFASIVGAIEEGRAIYANAQKFLTYILTHNVAELVPYLAFVLFKIPLPLTVMQILAIDLGTDTLPALALGAERPNPAAMRRPPPMPTDRLLNWQLLVRAYLFLGPIEAVAAMAAFFWVLHGGAWRLGQELPRTSPLYLQATTACLSAIIVMQIVNMFLCRSDRESVLSTSLFANPLILFGIAAEIALILLVNYTPIGNRVFGTAPISLETWLFMIPFGLGLLALEEGRKLIVRRSRRQVLLVP